MCDSHGRGRLVASLYAAVLAQADVEALVNKRLVGVVVVRQQRLLELAFVFEDSLERRGRNVSANVTTWMLFFLFSDIKSDYFFFLFLNL